MSAGQSTGKSKSKSDNSFSFSQNVPAWQANALSQMFGTASNLFQQIQPKLQNLQPGAVSTALNVSNAAQPAWQNALQGGIFGNVDSANLLQNSLQKSLDNPSETSRLYAGIMGGQGNTYADALKAAFMGDANRATANMLSNLDARAEAAGMSGGARHGIASSQGLYDINSNLQRNLADIGYNTFDKDLTNKLNIAQMADSNTLSRQQMLQQMLGQQQDTSNSAINAGSNIQNLGLGAFAPYMVPWESFNSYANALGAPIILSNGSGRGNSNAKGLSGSFGAGL